MASSRSEPCNILLGQCVVGSHFNRICELIPYANISDSEICSYIKYFCPKLTAVNFDNPLQSPLHVACRYGRRYFIRWLVRSRNIDAAVLNKMEEISPLSLCLIWGHLGCAVELISLGAKMGEKEHKIMIQLSGIMKSRAKKEEPEEPLRLAKRGNNLEDRIAEPEATRRRERMNILRSFNFGDIGAIGTPFDAEQFNYELDFSYTKKYLDAARTRPAFLELFEEGQRRENLHKEEGAELDVFHRCVSKEIITYTVRASESDSNVEGGDLYVWGENGNYTIGYMASSNPHLLEDFHRDHPTMEVKKVCLQQYHSILLTTCGRVFTCGHGIGGRLGHGDEATVINFKQLKIPLAAIDVAGSKYHSMVLLDTGYMYVFGLNTNNHLNFKNNLDAKVLSPTKLPTFEKDNRKILGVCSSDYHCVAWTRHTLYMWGYDGGQMGRQTERTHTMAPVVMPVHTECKFVRVSNGATVIATEIGSILCLTRGQLKKIISGYEDVAEIVVLGGTLFLPETVEGGNISLLLLDSEGEVRLWTDKYNVQNKFHLALVANYVKHMCLAGLDMLFVLKDGRVYRVPVRLMKDFSVTTSPLWPLIKAPPKIYFEVDPELIDKLHRAIKVFSDPKGDNMAAIVENHKRCVPDAIRIARSCMNSDMKAFYLNTDESDDIHDIILSLPDGSRYPAHKYILILNSARLQGLIFGLKSKILPIEKVNPLIFKRLIHFMYFREVDLARVGAVPQDLHILCPPIDSKQKRETGLLMSDLERIREEQYTQNYTDPIFLMRDAAVLFDLPVLVQILQDYIIHNRRIYKVPLNIPSIDAKDLKFTGDWLQCENLQDVDIECSDGTSYRAHKCIMLARSQYFATLYSDIWNTSKQKRNTFKIKFDYPGETVYFGMQYIYTDEVSDLDHLDLKAVCEVMRFADYYNLSGLVDYCAQSLSLRMTPKTAAGILTYANYIPRTENLKQYCYDYILRNLPAFLEFKQLEEFDNDLLDELSDYYQEVNPHTEEVFFPTGEHEDYKKIVEIANKDPIDPRYDFCEFYDQSPDKPGSASKPHKRRTKSMRKSTSDSKMIEACVDEIFPELKRLQIESNYSECAAGPSSRSDGETSICSSKENSRIDAIIKAQKTVEEEGASAPDFTVLGSAKKEEDIFGNIDFPELGSQKSPISSDIKPQSPTNKPDWKIKKVSQKQRKQQLEMDKEQPKTVPKNPWKIEEACSPPSSVDAEVNICKIISFEKKQKETITKMQSKLLIYTLMEDKALEELNKFYNTANICDEIITIERVQINVTVDPVWVQRTNKVFS